MDDELGGIGPAEEATAVSGVLKERPRSRLYWFGGWAAAAVVCVVLAFVLQLPSEDQARARLWLCLGAAVLLAIGLIGLRMGITADASVVTVSNLFTRYKIPWAELADIELEDVPGDVSIGMSRMVFVKRDGRRVVAAAPTGRAEPGRHLFVLRHTLLAMRDANAPQR